MPEISISHSHNLAVAAAMQRRCGIDIQQCRSAVVRVKSRFCEPGEAELLAASLAGFDEVSRLTMLWSAKEAIRKAVPVEPLPAFAEMELVAVREGAAGGMTFDCIFQRHARSVQFAVGVAGNGDYGMALVEMPGSDQAGEK